MRTMLKGTPASCTMLLLLQALCIGISSACTIATFTAPTSAGTLTHKIGTGDQTLTIPAWTQQDSGGSACSYTETLTFSPALSGYSWISVSGRVVTINSSSSGDVSVNQLFTVTSTLDNSPTNSNDNGYTFTVAMTNPCSSYTAPSSPADYSY